jgi:hypothetical protein
MTDSERSYFRERAEAEINAAQAARHPEAAKAHYRLAGYYLDLAHNPDATIYAFAVQGDG